MTIVLQNEQIEGGDEAIGGVAGDQIYLLVLQGPRQQTKIHDARRLGKMQVIGGNQSLEAIGPLHEFVAKAGAPMRRVGGSFGDGCQMQAASIVAANFNGEGVVEAERRTDCQMKTAGVLTLHHVVDLV